MNITEVRVKLCANSQERLLGFCSITIENSFVVRDLKIISGSKGAFVAMPSRKLCDRCPKCGNKNHLRANYCAQCGRQLQQERANHSDAGRAKLFADIAHPINSHCRDQIQSLVLKAYEEEIVLARQEGYICRYDDYGEEFGDDVHHLMDSGTFRLDPAEALQAPHPAPATSSVRKQADEFGDGLFA